MFKKLLAFLVLAALVGCAQKPFNPNAVMKEAGDEQTAEFPPTDDELVFQPGQLLLLVTATDASVTQTRVNEVYDFVSRSFKANTGGNVLAKDEVMAQLESPDYHGLQTENVADAIRLANGLNTQFVGQVQVTIMEARNIKGVDHYKANVRLAFFEVTTGQIIVQQEVIFDSTKPDKSLKNLKKVLQTYFKTRGFILETKGGQLYSRINLGRAMGIKLDREFAFHTRQVSETIVNGQARKNINYSMNAVATGKVVFVGENESWIQVHKSLKGKMKTGQPVFALPEKTSLF